MKTKSKLPTQTLRACARRGLRPSRHVLVVDISRQKAALYSQTGREHKLVKTLRCSTSKYGIGEKTNSNMTPRGLHRVARKIGGGWPGGTSFSSRQMNGYTWQGNPTAPITTRIFWLEGLEPGLNRGGDVDSHARYIYVHGTGDETTLGRPASHGCVHLAAVDLIPLYDRLPRGTMVWIAEKI